MDRDPGDAPTSGGVESAQGTRSGRKGDPRMHRAVAARLADPRLSLFEALVAGGFDYAADDDSQAVDADHVTLGQRKNQLSRRLRTARRENSSTWSNSGSGAGRGRKRSSDMLDEFGDCGDSNSADEANEVRAVKAKNHPDYRGPIIVLPARRQNDRPTSHSLDETFAYTSAVGHGAGQLHDVHAAAVSSAQQPQVPVSQFVACQGGVPQMSPGTGSFSGGPLPSGVAVASLNSTAQKMGMTLEQLALSLSHCANLSRVLAAISPGGSGDGPAGRHETLAQNLCLAELRSLYTRCMLLAGFGLQDAQEDSPKCVEFASRAWEAEGRRLAALRRSKHIRLAPPGDSSDDGAEGDAGEDFRRTDLDRKIPAVDSIAPATGEATSHRQGQEGDGRLPSSSSSSSSSSASCPVPCEEGRHAHRIQGCGHRAILHQPENGPAHIDFVVGDKIECYQGLQPPTGPAESAGAMNIWPSQYKCEDVSCANPACGTSGPASASASPPSAGHGHHQHGDEAAGTLPRILDLSSLDLDGKEWISDIDDTLLSLFKLSDPNPGDGKPEDREL